MTLSQYAAEHFHCLDSSLAVLNCEGGSIHEIDVPASLLAVLMARYYSSAEHCLIAPSLLRQVKTHALKLSTKSHVRTDKDCTPSLSQKRPAEGQCGADKSSLNVAVCHSLRDIILRHNNLQTQLSGIIVFQNVQRLDLSYNRVFTITACEPLALLPHLKVLTLLGNPVQNIIHYRSHLLMLCGAPSACRLQNLDHQDVTALEVVQASKDILEEQAFMATASRHSMIANMTSMMLNRLHLHREMRRRGQLYCDARTAVTLLRLLALVCDGRLQEYDSCVVAGSYTWMDPTTGNESFRSCAVAHRRSNHHGSASSSSSWCLAAAAVTMSECSVRSLFSLAEFLGESPQVAVEWFVRGRATPEHGTDRNSSVQRASSTPSPCRDAQRLAKNRVAHRISLLRRLFHRWHQELLLQRHRHTSLARRCLKMWSTMCASHQHVHHQMDGIKRYIFFNRWRRASFLKFSLRDGIATMPQSMATVVARGTRVDAPRSHIQAAQRTLLQLWQRSLRQRQEETKSACRPLAEEETIIYDSALLNVKESSSQTETDISDAKINDLVDAATQTSPSNQGGHDNASSSPPVPKVQEAAAVSTTRNEQGALSSLCDEIQREKLHLLQIITRMELEAAANRIEMNRLRTNDVQLRGEIQALGIDRDEALIAVERYESDRAVHLKMLRESHISQSGVTSKRI